MDYSKCKNESSHLKQGIKYVRIAGDEFELKIEKLKMVNPICGPKIQKID